jgi:hypothetical protein
VLIAEILREPWWLLAWIGWLGVVNAASLAFLAEVEARWTLAAFVGTFALMSVLYEMTGYNRLLGLAHVVCWTPLVVYLYGRLTNLVGPPLFESWIRVLLATNGLSLVIDYVDVARYLLGDRG